MNKRYTEKTAAAVCRKILKTCKENRPKNAEFHTGWMDAAGRACFCDGFRACRLTAPVDGVPMAEPGKVPMNLDIAFQMLDAGKVVEMPAPDPGAVKSFMAENADKRGHGSQPYDLGEFYPLVNPEYVYDVLRLFPGAKWYVSENVQARPSAPVFIVHEQGTACILPIRPGPAKRSQFEESPATVEEPAADWPPRVDEKAQAEAVKRLCTEYAFFIYARFPGDTRFFLADLSNGAYKVTKFRAPRYKEQDAPALMEALDRTAALNPGASFQLRKLDGKTVVYTAVPTFSPDEFAEQYAA